MDFKALPKAVQKTIRYILQDAPIEKLEVNQKQVNQAIKQRKTSNTRS
ncbi:hypothetical protein [Mangrovibacillus cuniculi]|uniref:Uncharacterized protein n=1 Tax=Mangrovibacillus cuniculi TaxID=2593652 RepID=A0A7S8HGP7_9BACI|nr:hypothetical protein [Mangrovibacillus cuniculi]QPC47660.1 hypothetical protein G8O30_12200 [Mangrovibacillus cuniculi]